MKKKIVVIIILISLVVMGLFLSTGGKMAAIYISDYSISEDGNEMTLKVGMASSMGYVRTYKMKQDNNKLYLTFYSTYGLNSNIGAKNEFQINLKPSVDEIYFYSGNNDYELRLQKNRETKDWGRVR